MAPPSMRRLAPWITALAMLGLYLSTFTAGNTFDAVIYAQAVERAASMSGFTADFFTPTHVLHLPLAAGVTWLLHAASLPVGGLFVLTLLAALGGAAMAGFMVAALADDVGLPLAVTTAVAAGLAAGTWFFATDGETNHLALALTLAALLHLRRVLAGQPTWRSIIWAGCLLGVAGGFHLTIGTAWIALLLVGLASWRTRLRPVVATLSVASIVLAIVHVPRLVMLMRHVRDWRFVHVISFSGESSQGGYLLKSGFHPIDELLNTIRSFGPDAGLASTLAIVLPAAWLLAGLVALALRRGGPMLALSGAWLLFTVLLYGAWADLDFEFACFMSTPLAIFGALGVGALVPSARARLCLSVATGLLAALIGIAAWRGTIAPQLDPSANPYRQLADMVAAATSPTDCVLASELAGNRSKVYIGYFGQREAVIPEFFFGPRIDTTESLRRLTGKMRERCARGAGMFVLPQLIEPGPPAKGWDADAVRSLLNTLEPRAAVTDPATGRVLLYQLMRCAPPL